MGSKKNGEKAVIDLIYNSEHNREILRDKSGTNAPARES